MMPLRRPPVATVAVLVAAAAPACSDEPCGPDRAVVDRVIDGDTIVAGGVAIRYLLVDAPEISAAADACFGRNAAQFNADLVLGRTVELRYSAACQDRYGRTLAYVAVDGTDVNQRMIERGYACVLRIPPAGDERAGELEAIQAAARAARRGLWGACDPTPCK
jgi:micrococcal nuclease